MKAELERVLASELVGAQVLVSAQRRLAVDALAQGRDRPRRRDLEMAYNLNDCVELRWGAPEKSDEAVDLQAARIVGAAREDDGLPRLVPRAAPAAARVAHPGSGRIG